VVVMGMIIGRSLTPLNSSRTFRAVRRRETVRHSDDNSRRKVQNVRGVVMIGGSPRSMKIGLVACRALGHDILWISAHFLSRQLGWLRVDAIRVLSSPNLSNPTPVAWRRQFPHGCAAID
jgi:hypothetical protein